MIIIFFAIRRNRLTYYSRISISFEPFYHEFVKSKGVQYN